MGKNKVRHTATTQVLLNFVRRGWLVPGTAGAAVASRTPTPQPQSIIHAEYCTTTPASLESGPGTGRLTDVVKK